MKNLPNSTENSVWQDFSRWQEFMLNRYPGLEVQEPSKIHPFETSYEYWSCGEVEFTEIRSTSPLNLKIPDPNLITAEVYDIPLQLEGQFRGGQNNEEFQPDPHDIVLIDSQYPNWRELSPRSHLLNIRIPKKSLFKHGPNTRPAAARPLKGNSGKGAILWDFLVSVWKHRDSLSHEEIRNVSETATHMVATLLPTQPLTSKKSDPSRHLQRLLAYIRSHACNPYLSLNSAAEACGISPRYIHQLLLPTGKTFSRHLLECRLSECKNRLVNPTSRTTSITEIALSCGFNDVSHFSRSFRACYGFSPRAFRKSNTLDGAENGANSKGID